MNKLFLITFLLFTPLFADEIDLLAELIELTEQNLEEQLHTMELLRTFKKAKLAFVVDADNAQKGTHMVRCAVGLLSEIEKQHLTQIFPKDFVNELQFYNKTYHQQTKR